MAVTISIWHNPRCGTSRRALALLEEHGVVPVVRDYLNEPPSEAELRAALSLLDRAPRDILRWKEGARSDAGLTETSDDDALIAAMVAYPILIERPIVFSETRAVLGRPAEAVLDVLTP